MTTSLPRVYPIVDTAAILSRGRAVVPFAEALLEGGARLVQFRHKEAYSRQVFETATEVAALCVRAGAQLIVDDRADIAALLDAGLHLGQDDLEPRLARRVLKDSALIGFSTHNRAQFVAAEAEPVDYVALGPIFSTASKLRPDPVVGLEQLAEWRALTRRPLVAIGGITRETAHAVWRAGADAVAVIGDLMPTEMTKTTIRERMEEWLKLTE